MEVISHWVHLGLSEFIRGFIHSQNGLLGFQEIIIHENDLSLGAFRTSKSSSGALSTPEGFIRFPGNYSS